MEPDAYDEMQLMNEYFTGVRGASLMFLWWLHTLIFGQIDYYITVS